MKHLRTLVAAIAVGASALFSAGAYADDSYPGNYARAPRFKALIYYSTDAEPAHVQFAEQAIDFFTDLNVGNGFILDTTSSLAEYPYERLKEYDVMIVINTAPWAAEERDAFEKYMENGGGWVGFHAAGYHDASTKWPWFEQFLGAGTFLCNNWPPQPALLQVDVTDHPVTRNLPVEFVAAKCEWYMWNAPAGSRENVDVLLSLSPRNYPIGLKDIVSSGEWPIVWTNRNYRMIYLNIGHGDEEFESQTQNLLLINALRWIVSRSPKGDPFRK